MFTKEEMLDQEINESINNSVRFELDAMVRQSIIDWSREFGDKFTFATISAVNGKYDDVRTDVIKKRISLEDAITILQKLLDNKIISKIVFDFQMSLLDDLK